MTAPITPTPPPSPEALKASYGFVGALAGAIPELKAILDQAVREQWTSDRFIMAVSGSGWYRTNGDAAREWITLQAVDPESANMKLWTARNEINVLSGTLGVKLSGDQENEIAIWKVLNPNATAQVLSAHISRNYFSGGQDWTQLGGSAAALAGQIQEIGRAYGWDDFDNYDESRDWLQKIMNGEDTIDGFKRRMVDFAKVKYPGLHDMLLSGMTVKQIAEPYMQSMSKVLEMPSTAINWYDDKLIQEAMQYRPATGGNGGVNVESNGTMPIYQFEDKLRQDPRWNTTDNAKNSTAQMLTKIGKDFGMIGQ